ncbi:MAG: DHH family phosphoesterase [Candidatus Promineifilaceae bacterium]
MTSLLQHTLEKADHILVVTHVDPDGDAIGSLTAVGQALQQLGLRATLACDDHVPDRFSYLPLSAQVQRKLESSSSYDLVVAVDCADELRMGYIFADLPDPKPFIINIDHHVTNTRFGDINLIEPGTMSTAEVLHGLFGELGIVIDEGIAASLLTGLITDTGGFRHVGVSASTLRTAADLVDAGADLGFVTMQALNLRAFSTMKLWRIGMDKMQLEDGLIWTAITNQERQAAQFRSSSSVGLTNLLADVEEAVMAAVLMEAPDGSVKVSLRCRPPYEVADIAVSLGGGGHPLAAGCTLSGPLADAESTIVEACKAAIQRQAELDTSAATPVTLS